MELKFRIVESGLAQCRARCLAKTGKLLAPLSVGDYLFVGQNGTKVPAGIIMQATPTVVEDGFCLYEIAYQPAPNSEQPLGTYLTHDGTSSYNQIEGNAGRTEEGPAQHLVRTA